MERLSANTREEPSGRYGAGSARPALGGITSAAVACDEAAGPAAASLDDPGATLLTPNESDDVLDGRRLDLWHGRHVAELPVMLLRAGAHGPMKGEIGVAPGAVEIVHERRALLGPARGRTVADRAVHAKELGPAAGIRCHGLGRQVQTLEPLLTLRHVATDRDGRGSRHGKGDPPPPHVPTPNRARRRHTPLFGPRGRRRQA